MVVFRNGGATKEAEKWHYNGNILDIVKQFNYLGMLFNFNGKFQDRRNVPDIFSVRIFISPQQKSYFTISEVKVLYFDYFPIEPNV